MQAGRQNTTRQRRCDVQCQAFEDANSLSSGISRRAAIGGSIALASVAALQSSLPAEARVVSSDWEKVDLPVDPGVVLLDIGFTDEKHGEDCHQSICSGCAPAFMQESNACTFILVGGPLLPCACPERLPALRAETHVSAA